jgi:hypothetical protein
MAKRAFSSPRGGDAGPGLEKGAPRRTGHFIRSAGAPRGCTIYVRCTPGPGTPDFRVIKGVVPGPRGVL